MNDAVFSIQNQVYSIHIDKYFILPLNKHTHWMAIIIGAMVFFL